MGVATLVLPTRTDVPLYSFTTQLEGVTYGFTFRWNGRDSAWYFDLSDSDGNPLLSGRKVVLGAFLLARFRTPGLPPGEMQAVDTSGANVDAGLDELGARVQLLYIESTDLPAGFLG